MKERPIIFSAESVRAILECRKTQSRRIVKPQHRVFDCQYKYGKRGDRLWVREPWRISEWFDAAEFTIEYGDGANKCVDAYYEWEDDKVNRYVEECVIDCKKHNCPYGDLENRFYPPNNEENLPTRWRNSMYMPKLFA